MRGLIRWGMVLVITASFLGGTLAWNGTTERLVGFGDELTRRPPRIEFLFPSFQSSYEPGGLMTTAAGPTWARVDWTIAGGAAVHIEQSISPIPAAGPQGEVLSGRLSAWRTGTALEGRVNTLSGKVGRFFVSVEGPLPYDELFKIAESLRLSRPLGPLF